MPYRHAIVIMIDIDLTFGIIKISAADKHIIVNILMKASDNHEY